MSPQEQRIVIAEYCRTARPYYMDGVRYIDSPNYVTSLDAMHQAEKCISGVSYWNRYVEILGSVCGQESTKRISKIEDVMATIVVCATSEQRAEAFLRTLNLWKEKS